MSLRQSLHAEITASLKMGERSAGFENAILSNNRTRVNHCNETELWDYKEFANLNEQHEIAKLAKIVLAFHNQKGGAIVYGVRNDYVVTGIPETNITDTKRLRDALRPYVGDIGVFQDRIALNRNDRFLWVVFVPAYKGSPVPAQKDAPTLHTKDRLFRKGQYFLRLGDESKIVHEPADFKRLFTGISFTHLATYEYDIDEPYFLLLAPHHDELIGRAKVKQQLYEKLHSRWDMVSLDGLGGVGKSALAIELVRELYDARSFEFIVSLSAKARVWQNETATRKAHFAGLSELLREIARVLLPGEELAVDDLRREVIDIMKGAKGLLFIDNLENIRDETVIDFLHDIPQPVKVLITSKVSRGLPADTLLIPELKTEQATLLFEHELKRIGVVAGVGSVDAIENIVSETGGLPLALKWAAAMAAQTHSLGEVLARLRRGGVQKSELLQYCFTEMVDGLTDTARDCALLCAYLPADAWNVSVLRMALGRSATEVEMAIRELEDKRLIVSGCDPNNRYILPLTVEYLTDRLAVR